MKTIQQICERITELVLLLILLMLPFAYGSVNTNGTIFLSAFLSVCIFWYISKRIKPISQGVWKVFFAILFMFLFDFAEQVNFIRQFNITVDVAWRIPLSTVLLAIGMLALLIKIMIAGKVTVIRHPFVRYFLFACLFLVISMILFYPFLYFHYRMQPGPDILLLNKILKYLMIFLLIMDYLSDRKKIIRIDLSFIFSISLTVILSIVV